MRTFETGATRDDDETKCDYEGFLSPVVIRRFGEYMHMHRTQKDGKLRDSDNWQRGIPMDQYMKSLVRHLIDAWGIHRGQWVVGREGESMEELLCAVMFNTMGYLHTILNQQQPKKQSTKKTRRDCTTCKHGLQPVNGVECSGCFGTSPHTKWESEDA